MVNRVLLPFRHAKKLAPYVDAVKAGGMEPVPVDVSGPIDWGDAQGLVLLGGTDVNPERYGVARHPETEQPDDERDKAEWQLIDVAIHRDVPILAICRGLQILNVYHGGTLVQHLATSGRHDVDTADRGFPAHAVAIEAASLLGAIANGSEWQVNSRHHQAVDRVGERLRVVAQDSVDGTIEGLERSDKRFVVGVQWHPEDQITRSPEQLRLFKRFAESVSC